MKEVVQPLWNIYMRNQKLETELAYKSAKCNTLRQCGVITDPLHYKHTQHGVFFVAHKAIIVRTSKISLCLSHIFLILTGVSRDGRKITTTRKHLTISFDARRNRYKNDKYRISIARGRFIKDYLWLKNRGRYTLFHRKLSIHNSSYYCL